jgi:hypothetical protein
VKRTTCFLVCLVVMASACTRETVRSATASQSPPQRVRLAKRCALLDGSLPTPHGKFSGDPSAIWLTEPTPDRLMCLTEDFTFTDPHGKDWRTPADYKVDGASIPRALWSIVGSPYTGDYRRASIVHDKACDDAHGDKKKRREADRMFYHGCRAGGCSVRQSIVLYLGVRIGALSSGVPAWKASIESDNRGPDVQMTASDQKLVSDFQKIAGIVLSQGEIDDPELLEQRTDSAASAVVGRDMRGE